MEVIVNNLNLTDRDFFYLIVIFILIIIIIILLKKFVIKSSCTRDRDSSAFDCISAPVDQVTVSNGEGCGISQCQSGIPTFKK